MLPSVVKSGKANLTAVEIFVKEKQPVKSKK
jgi:hypothetical protein